MPEKKAHNMQHEKLKRDHGQGGGGGDNEEEDENAKKSERKRQREKQRRSDLTNAFDELAAMIARIDNEAGEDGRKGKRSSRADGGEGDTVGPSRLELIGRTLTIMERQNRENEELKQTVAHLRETIERNRDQVLVMVPRLVPTGDPRVASFPPPPHHHTAAATYPTQAEYSTDPYNGLPPPAAANFHAQQPPLGWSARPANTGHPTGTTSGGHPPPPGAESPSQPQNYYPYERGYPPSHYPPAQGDNRDRIPDPRLDSHMYNDDSQRHLRRPHEHR